MRVVVMVRRSFGKPQQRRRLDYTFLSPRSGGPPRDVSEHGNCINSSENCVLRRARYSLLHNSARCQEMINDLWCVAFRPGETPMAARFRSSKTLC